MGEEGGETVVSHTQMQDTRSQKHIAFFHNRKLLATFNSLEKLSSLYIDIAITDHLKFQDFKARQMVF